MIAVIEEWRPVVGFEAHYEVSSAGWVRSFKNGIPLAGSIDRCGYRRVCVYTRETGPINKGVARLVCEAFHGPPNKLHREVAHLDGTRLNNRAENLKWVSHAENISHKRLHDTHQAGEKHPRAKLTEAEAAAILTRAGAGESMSALAREFRVAPTTIKDIRDGRRWKHLPAGRERDQLHNQSGVTQ